ncbi:hypothetical protein W97_03446 [Coniosporium apollinis CBS 100218]|uniref:BTB domain-containing protein n=1 Tax=Coniosporium apollinis (strain CBS 100218) TaxID=1168221 RepID=R7YRE7_CONA1|nr:uncharacterized protein W97_03446 [Coniosporium apollinis CBS 100218]EON64216.1 hypothetical protein W97_03446 [Coniosporium apollinis CBS 100218]
MPSPFENDPEFSDLVLRYQGKKFYVHKFILSFECTWFTYDLNGDYKQEIELEDKNPEGIHRMLMWLYSGTTYPVDFSSTAEDIRVWIATWVTAVRYDLGDLIQALESPLEESKPSEAEDLLRFAKMVYSATDDQYPRRFIAGICKSMLPELISCDGTGQSFKALLNEFDDLWMDLAKADQHEWTTDASA